MTRLHPQRAQPAVARRDEVAIEIEEALRRLEALRHALYEGRSRGYCHSLAVEATRHIQLAMNHRP